MAVTSNDIQSLETSGSATVGGQTTMVSLSPVQKARMEHNRQKALLLKQARLASHPYFTNGHRVKGASTVVDTGAGFFIDDDQHQEDNVRAEIHQEPGPILPHVSDLLLCEGCSKEFLESYLHNHFDMAVCDCCRESDEKYGMITKTDAKKMYMLKDADFDVREPLLKFILRKNPHSRQWGDMKLFLELQVHARAMEVWGNEDKLEEARQQRILKNEKAKKKKFYKKVKELRMAVRSSTWRKKVTGHEHEYGEESYSDANGEYSKACKTCGHVLTYEKM